MQVLQKASKAQGVLVTAGGLGSSYAFRGTAGMTDLNGFVPVLKVDVEDTTGAGDAYLAGFIHAMVQAGGLDALRSDAGKLQRAVEFAAACGAFTTTRPGGIDAQPSLQEAEQLAATGAFAE